MSLKFNRWLHQKGFSRRKLHGSWLHGVLGDGILAKELWSLEPESVARAWLIGVMVTIIPFLPLQSLIAVPLAILFRANVPIVYVLQWVSNPITAFIHLPACYYFGCLLLRVSPSGAFEEGMKKIEENGWNAVGQLSFQDVIGPLYVGAVALGLLISVIGYFLIRAYWPAPKKRAAMNRPPHSHPL